VLIEPCLPGLPQGLRPRQVRGHSHPQERGGQPPPPPRPLPPCPSLRVLTWNTDSLLNGGSALALSKLLEDTRANIVVVTKTELAASDAPFDHTGYTSFRPLVRSGGMTRVLILVKTTLAVAANARLCLDIMDPTVQSVWVRLDAHVLRAGGRAVPLGSMTVGGVYRQWSIDGKRGAGLLQEQFDVPLGQIAAACETSRQVLVSSDFNLDVLRQDDLGYYEKARLELLRNATEAAGLKREKTGPTWCSYGVFNGKQRYDALDHVYSTGLKVKAEVLEDTSTNPLPAPDHGHGRRRKQIGGHRSHPPQELQGHQLR
jgi:hypothetical protein